MPTLGNVLRFGVAPQLWNMPPLILLIFFGQNTGRIKIVPFFCWRILEYPHHTPQKWNIDTKKWPYLFKPQPTFKPKPRRNIIFSLCYNLMEYTTEYQISYLEYHGVSSHLISSIKPPFLTGNTLDTRPSVSRQRRLKLCLQVLWRSTHVDGSGFLVGAF